MHGRRFLAGSFALLAASVLVGTALTARPAVSQDTGTIQAVIQQDFAAPVNVTAPITDGNVLTYNGTLRKWTAASGGGGGVTSIIAGTGIGVSGATGAVTITNTGTLAQTLANGTSSGAHDIAMAAGQVVSFATGPVAISGLSGNRLAIGTGAAGDVTGALTLRRFECVGIGGTDSQATTLGAVGISTDSVDRGVWRAGGQFAWSTGAATADVAFGRGDVGVLWVSTGDGQTLNSNGTLQLGTLTLAGTGQASWLTGGSPTVTAPQIKGPSDATMFFVGGDGRALYIQGGNPASSSGNSSSVTIASANGGSSSGASGAITIQSGTTTDGNAGSIGITANNATGTSRTGGSLTLASGNSTGAIAAGSITGTAGQSVTGIAGGVSFVGGVGGSTSGDAGSVSMAGGNITTAGSSGGGGQALLAGGLCHTGGGATTGIGGQAQVNGGTGGGLSGAGGLVNIIGGSGRGSSSGPGGVVTVKGGPGSTSSSNNSAGGILLHAGVSSGTGFANITMQSSVMAASGSSGQSTGDRLMVCGKRLVLSNTTATATAFASLSTVSGSAVAGTCFYSVEATDGTEWSCAGGQFDFAVVNKAGTLTVGTTLVQTEVIANSTVATLATTGTPTVVASGTAILLKVTPAFTGTNAAGVTSCKVSWEIHTRGQTTITPQ